MSFQQLPNEVILINCESQDSQDIYALMKTCRRYYALLRRPLHQNNIDYKRSSGLVWAARYGKIGIAAYFLQLPGVDCNATDSDGGTPLIYAVQNQSVASIRMLLAHDNVDVNLGDKLGPPILHAVFEDCYEAARIVLADARVNPNLASSKLYGSSPLTIIASEGDLEMLEIFLRTKRVDVNYHMGELLPAPLLVALQGGHEMFAIRLLQETGIDLNCQDRCRFNPLIKGLEAGHRSFVAELLKQDGMELNHQDYRGRTALMIAAKQGDTEVLGTLLSNNAVDRSLVDRSGKGLLDYATEPRVLAIIDAYTTG